MRKIRPLRNEADYDRALAKVARYFENPPMLGTEEADRFDLLTKLVEAYETEHWPIESTGPLIRRYHLDQ